MPDYRQEIELPPMLRDDGIDVPYTAEQLAPTLKRLRDALEKDLAAPHGTPQARLAAAWTRIAELRLPRKAVPARVLDEIETLVARWDTYGDGNPIARHAATLTDPEVETERERIAWMLRRTEAAANLGYTTAAVPTE
jgi:hypothetical protein